MATLTIERDDDDDGRTNANALVSIQCANGKEYDVGRHRECALRCHGDDQTVSRRHCAFRATSSGAIEARDLESQRGTRLLKSDGSVVNVSSQWMTVLSANDDGECVVALGRGATRVRARRLTMSANPSPTDDDGSATESDRDDDGGRMEDDERALMRRKRAREVTGTPTMGEAECVFSALVVERANAGATAGAARTSSGTNVKTFKKQMVRGMKASRIRERPSEPYASVDEEARALDEGESEAKAAEDEKRADDLFDDKPSRSKTSKGNMQVRRR